MAHQGCKTDRTQLGVISHGYSAEFTTSVLNV
jgi:hypothetical protein